ncbi:NUDIX hydrolase [Haloechinothrix sp. LS1_15]|uniref:NUDIX hydrolase n=1 Tax=Haloechinothrix sp. LS1_15 TaxID=2652248 RepID=UPI0029450BB6|nr:NUDIX hydrolase [Haloechinothrix sp. LS1_15]MDV6014344.1 NUDIX hydrolase [Haloechinothrix sp. LS1_15]
MPDDRPPVATPRVAAGIVLTDTSGHVLMLRTAYKDFWDIPGGYVESGESPRSAAAREVREELGFDVRIGRLLAVDWAPSESEGDKLLFVFEGQRLDPDADFTFADGEIAEARYVSVDELADYTIDRLARRLRAVMSDPAAAYLENGRPVEAPPQ